MKNDMNAFGKDMEDMKNRLDLDAFGKIMDEFLTKNNCQMLITIPEGTQEAQIESNLGELGPVTELYLLLLAVKPAVRRLCELVDGKMDIKGLARGITDLLYKGIVEAAGERGRA